MDKRGTIVPVAGWITMAILCSAQLMLIVDVVIVNVALPSIKRGLDIPDAQLQLTSIAYTLTFGSLLIVGGRAGDLFGRRRLLLAGIGVFTLASLFSGSSQEGWQLFASRALQGIGAAAISPNALALITSTFAEGSERNRALGVWAAVGSAGAVLGQVVGGLITDLAGWRWIFLINIPIGVVAMVAAIRYLPENRADVRPRLDLAGATLLAGGLAALTFALSRFAAERADALFVVAMASAMVLFAAFAMIERRGREPLVRFGLFANRGVRIGNAVLALNAAALGGALFFTSLYLQLVLDYSPRAVGFAFAPITLIVLIVSPFAGKFAERIGVHNLLLAGAVLASAGLLYLTNVSASGSYATDVLPGLALLALASGLSFAPTYIAGTTGVAAEDQGLASGLLNTSQELGLAIGLALLASVATVSAQSAETLTSGYRAGFLGAFAFVAMAALLVAWTQLSSRGKRRPMTEPADASP
ncbi:MAG: MFS transporter [Thermomicrobiales bacterium]